MAEKKKNIFKRIAQKFRDVRLEMKKAVWPSKEKLKQTSAVVLVVIVFFAIFYPPYIMYSLYFNL